MKSLIRFKVLWHEPSNTMAMVDPWFGGLPKLHVCSDEFKGVNPFLTYPLSFLINHYGWVEVGEL